MLNGRDVVKAAVAVGVVATAALAISSAVGSDAPSMNAPTSSIGQPTTNADSAGQPTTNADSAGQPTTITNSEFYPMTVVTEPEQNLVNPQAVEVKQAFEHIMEAEHQLGVLPSDSSKWRELLLSTAAVHKRETEVRQLWAPSVVEEQLAAWQRGAESVFQGFYSPYQDYDLVVEEWLQVDISGDTAKIALNGNENMLSEGVWASNGGLKQFQATLERGGKYGWRLLELRRHRFGPEG